MNFRNIFLIITTITTCQSIHAIQNYYTPINVIPNSQYYLPMIPNGANNTDRPYALFLNHNQTSILAKVKIDQWNDKTERYLDSLLDPKKAHAKITSAEIRNDFPLKLDKVRGIVFFDNTGKCTYGSPYCGPLDVKNYRENPGEPFLFRPHSIYSNLKTVTEYTHMINFPFYAIRYPKKVLTYKDDGSIEQATTIQHKMAIATQVSLATIAAGLVIKKLADRFK